MKKQIFSQRGVFRRFLITYIVIMIAFLSALGVISGVMLRSVNEYDINEQYRAVSSSNEVLNRQMINIRNLFTSMENDSGAVYTTFLKGKSRFVNVSSEDLIAIKKELYEDIRLRVSLNSVIEDIYLFSEEDNSVVFSHGSVDLSIMYDNLLKFGDMSLHEFRETYLTGRKFREFMPAMSIYNAGNTTDSLLYIESYPLDAVSEPTGYIVISLKLDEILKILGYSADADRRQICLYDANDRLLYSSFRTGDGKVNIDKHGICTIDGRRYFACFAKNDSDISFMSASLYNSALRKTIGMRVLVASILFAVVLVGLALSVRFAKFNTRPIRELTDKLGAIPAAEGEAYDEYTYIASSIDSIINDAAAIKRDFETERPALINDFTNSLLMGSYNTREEIDRTQSKLGIDISGRCFVVMRTEIIGDTEDQEGIRYIQKSVVEEYRHRFKCLACLNGVGSVNIIFAFDSDNDAENTEHIENVTYIIGEALYKNLGLYLKCAIGGFYDSLADIPYSYENAGKLLTEGARVEYRNIVWCVSSAVTVSRYYYPNEIEQRLEFAFRNRDAEEIERVLALVERENSVNRALAPDAVRLLYMNMKLTIYNIMSRYCPELDEQQRWDIANSIDESPVLAKFFSDIQRVYRELLEKYKDEESGREILEYMDKAALDADFDRQVFARHFYISQEYVSRFFKENTGYGFTKYMMKVRMEKACELLADPRYNIEKIAGESGYSNVLSFRRAFKNYTGMTPSDYRRSLIEKNI